MHMCRSCAAPGGTRCSGSIVDTAARLDIVPVDMHAHVLPHHTCMTARHASCLQAFPDAAAWAPPEPALPGVAPPPPRRLATEIGSGAIALFSVFSAAAVICAALMVFWCWWRIKREPPYTDQLPVRDPQSTHWMSHACCSCIWAFCAPGRHNHIPRPHHAIRVSKVPQRTRSTQHAHQRVATASAALKPHL